MNNPDAFRAIATIGEGLILLEPMNVGAGKLRYPEGLNTPLMVVEYLPTFFIRTQVPEASVDGLRSITVPETDGFNKMV